MVAPVLAAAGIGAVGSLLGGLFGGSSAKKAANVQAQVTREQIAAQERARDQIVGLNQPAITRGNDAASLYGSFLGIGGGDAAAQGLATFRSATGYQDLMREGLSAVNSNAYARGTADSGATLRALQERGTQIANGSAQQYLGNLSGLISAGTAAAGNVAGVTQGTANNVTQLAQGGADAASNAALARGNAWGGAAQNIANLAAYAYGSSYGNRNPYGLAAGGID